MGGDGPQLAIGWVSSLVARLACSAPSRHVLALALLVTVLIECLEPPVALLGDLVGYLEIADLLVCHLAAKAERFPAE